MRRLASPLLVAALHLSAQTPERKETVVVTGAWERVPLEESDRPVRATPVDDESILLGNSAVDYLNRDASVDLRQRGQHNIQTDVSIRGATFGQTLVLLNGFRLNDVQSGHHNMDIPAPLETVQQVEVLKGSGSTLYGSDAIGGVIHVITRKPETSEIRVRGAGGSFGTNQQRVSAGYVRPAFSQQLSASRDFSSGFIPNRDYRNLALTSFTTLRSRAGETRLMLAHGDKPFGAEKYYGNFNSWERTKTLFASVDHAFGGRTQAGVAFRRHTDLFVLYRDRPQVFTNRHAAESWQASFRRWEPAGTNAKFHWGVEALHDSIESNNLGSHRRGRGAGYAALDVRALRRFSLSLGVREEVYRSADSQLSPTAAGGAWLASWLKVRGSVSRAFRLPSFTDLYYHDPANLGSPDLRPERAWNYEGGVDVHLGGRVRGDVTVFERRERDGIDYVRRSAADIWRATNFQRLSFTGVEANVTARVASGHVLDWSYTALRGAREQLAGIFSRYTFNYPRHLGVMGWHGNWRGLSGRVRAGAVERFARDPYAVLDLYLARSRGRLHPFIQLTNLTDTVYEEIFGVPMPGRAVVIGFEIVVARR